MIAFTYDLSTSVGQTRLYAGDTDPGALNLAGGDRTRTDDEVAFLLSENGGSPQLAAAALLEWKAAEYASAATSVAQGGLRQDFRERSARLLEAAAALRNAALAPLTMNAPSQDPVFTVGDGGTMEGW